MHRPQSVGPVVSKNLRGHRGIIEHTVSSNTDPDYDGLVIRGVQADILDNDNNTAYVSVVDQVRIISETYRKHWTFQPPEFSLSLCATRLGLI